MEVEPIADSVPGIDLVVPLAESVTLVRVHHELGWDLVRIGEFVEAHPTIKMLALSFLLLIGVTLMAEGLGVNFPKGYIYFAMAFAFGVETLNIRVRKRHAPEIVRLRKAQLADLLPPDYAGWSRRNTQLSPRDCSSE